MDFGINNIADVVRNALYVPEEKQAQSIYNQFSGKKIIRLQASNFSRTIALFLLTARVELIICFEFRPVFIFFWLVNDKKILF